MPTPLKPDEMLSTLKKLAKVVPDLAVTAPVPVISLPAYPNAGQVTLVTCGLSDHAVTSWRGLPCGFEMTMTVPEPSADESAKFLGECAHANIQLRVSQERRPFIEYNGIWAPGYPPHLLFCTALSQTPKFGEKTKLADRYVLWLPAIPVNDAELRLYDQGPPRLISHLQQQSSLVDWERR